MLRFFLIVTSLVLDCSLVFGAREADPLRPYFEAMKSLSKDCSMAYAATYLYADGERESVSGMMAIRGEHYYDSSNLRFVLKNDTWLLTADHSSRMLNVAYLPEFRAELSPGIDLDVSGFLFPELDLSKPSDFKFSKTTRDTLTASLQYRVSGGPAISLRLWYAPGSTVPARYAGTVTYPQENGQPTPALEIRFACSQVRPGANPVLFDDTRLIEMRGKRNARMKRFNNYLVYRRSI